MDSFRKVYSAFFLISLVLAFGSNAFAKGIEYKTLYGKGSLINDADGNWTLIQESSELVLEVSSFELGSEDTLQIIQSSPTATLRLIFPDDIPVDILGRITSSSNLEFNSNSEIHFSPSAEIISKNLKLSASKIKNKGKLSVPGGRIELLADSVVFDGGEVDTSQEEQPGGTIIINGKRWVSLGGKVTASGSSGGQIKVEAGGLNIAGSMLAVGKTGPGGSIELKTKRKSWENTSAYLDVSGTTGGSIRHVTDQQIATSGKYLALGENGVGGNIDITAPALKFLSPQINASGQTGGGQIRLGGELKGGKELTVDELPNAQLLSMTDGTQITADTLGPDGSGGTIIVWSEKKSTVLGHLSARPGKTSGNGGFIETSSADKLVYAGKALTGMGDRLGELLMDPKNIDVKEVTEVNQQAIIIGSGYDALNVGSQSLDNADSFGNSISLDGNRLAVGTEGDDGLNNSKNSSGSVYLYTFTSGSFSGGTLEAIIGSSYTGGKNIDQALDDFDFFGRSVSLDGNRLAVGTEGDDGFGNSGSSNGAVYLYSFMDREFSGGILEGKIGTGYTGGKNIDQALDDFDFFGKSVSLNGNRLVVGADRDDGSNNSLSNSGAVYLYSFIDNTFSGGTLEGTIGSGYSGGKNIDQILEQNDSFGISVSLEGNRLAVGIEEDEGEGELGDLFGAVHLYSFMDSIFSGGTLEATIGKGYTGGKNINQNLDVGTNFGFSLSLDGNRLAVGANSDYGFDNLGSSVGAVYLYSFTDSVFSGGILEAIIGSGYSGGKNIDQILDNEDGFGSSVSLDGNRLAVGANSDFGAGNSGSFIGAVYLYTFTDDTFSNGTLEATIGSGYAGGKNITQVLETDDQIVNVSLDGNRLAIGAWGDDGNGNTGSNHGAVFLYSFTDHAFSEGTLEATIGSGYTGGKNIDLNLDDSDSLVSVSLDENRLAVGAYDDDDGEGNFSDDTGAVYLFTFTDSSFSGGTLEATIGSGYSGGKNIDQDLDEKDFFAYSVSLDGNRLAVGVFGDDGFGISDTSFLSKGAVYLYSFSDSEFSGGNLEGIIGDGYSGTKDINQSLDEDDLFGVSVSLDGDRLAIGAWGDEGFGISPGSFPGKGSVYLYSFSDSEFSGGNLEGIIGDGYSGTKDINQPLDESDSFGISVSLDDNRLAVGAYGDDGSLGGFTGAVYLYSFTESVFSGGVLEAIIGSGYSGGKNINQKPDPEDGLGTGVSLDNNRLAVVANFDDGSDNTIFSAGAVYLYRFSDDLFSPLINSPNAIGNANFADFPGQDSCISSSILKETLESGTNITLQANNDITLSSTLTVDNPNGSDGSLTLQAGRSILIKNDITFEDGDLTLIANETPANGVDSLFRDVGEASVNMINGTAINIGSGDLTIEMREGDNHAFTDCGTMNLQTLDAANISIDSACNTSNIALNGPIAGTSISITADKDITTTAGADMTATGPISIIADSDFNNDAGSGGILDLVFGTVIDAGFSSITLSADEGVGTGSLITQSSSSTAISIESKSSIVGATGEEPIDISAPNGGVTVSSAGDFGSNDNFVIGDVFSLDFSGVGGQSFFQNSGASVAFNQSASSVLENAGTVFVPVSLNKVNGTTTVDYSVTGGSASGSGTDYTLANGTLTFTPGDTMENISISLAPILHEKRVANSLQAFKIRLTCQSKKGIRRDRLYL